MKRVSNQDFTLTVLQELKFTNFVYVPLPQEL